MANLQQEYLDRVTGVDPQPETPEEAAANLAAAIENADVSVQAFAANGETPVGKQSITGALAQDQIDSIVAALVALGLATDDR